MILAALRSLVKVLLTTLLTEKMIITLMIGFGDWLVPKSTNTLDDQWWPTVKRALEEAIKAK